MLLEYILIFKYFFFCLLLALILFFVSFLIVYQNANSEKISVYECGFSPFGDSRSRFEVRFYIVAILFMIFDLEIVFLFPWVLSLDNMSNLGFVSMMFFLFVLIVGFIYEWCKGALDWE